MLGAGQMGNGIAHVGALSGLDVRLLDISEDALKAALKRDLPSFMQPHAIEWREALPLNPNGKIDRTALYREVSERIAA